MPYTLFNKMNGKKLVHPSCGLWYTSNIEDAEDMYKACLEFLKAADLESIIPQISIVDAESLKEINLIDSATIKTG